MPIPEGFEDYAALLGFPKSETMGRILEILFDGEDDVKVTSGMPGTISVITEKCGLSEEKVREVVDRLFSRGILIRTMRKTNYYRLFSVMIELRDSTVIYWKDAPQELYELWQQLLLKEMGPLLTTMKEMKIKPMVRVIPVEETIDSQNMILDVDSAKKIFSNAELVSAVPCACRTLVERTGGMENCPAPEKAVCMQTNAFAKQIIDRGAGEQLTNEEALKRIVEAEQAGLVHVVRNNINEDMFMCNCCSCCCAGLHFINVLDCKDMYAPSRFKAEINLDDCNTCGICEEKCQFNAIVVDDETSIIEDSCYGCGVCVANCPEGALSLEEIRPKEFIKVS
ncbi:MAG: 4Fe-4S binding protein [Desulfobacterales bacterium]|jgi:NAD-dependent dihydropyrimidine dehydrogenase PreA subunit/DNA-binding Lrp family transcriptional regulator|nr:4Fe-4S binding protein [Desulfobacteraceae bacterium]MBT4363512.1 4Fe-4S binding protein [Desulfobacteraceae bacterium]MBT7086018.1 4Fe-4S binding protein [Desulfobacterales bacterium]MBT7696644.1 4Fe-4S binding protein [Desulfobacterales bacterium]